MALGATLKVKMDTTAVSRGLSGMKSKISRAFGAIKKVGMAAFGAIAAAAAGLLAASVNATKFVRSVELMGIQTGMSVKEVLDLQHAFKLVMVDADSAADTMSEFQKRLAEARKGQGEALMGLEELGVSLDSLTDLTTMEAFEKVMRAVGENTLGTSEALLAMEKLFGSRGFELTRLAANYDKIMAKARKDTAGLASQFADTSKFKSFEESMARGSLFAREIQMRLVNALPLEKIGEILDKVDLDKFFENLSTEFEEFIKAPEAKFVEWGFKVGIAMGEGIVVGMFGFLTSKEGIKTIAENLTIPGILTRNMKGKKESAEKRRETESPVERRERESKMRFNPHAWEDLKRMLGFGNKNQAGTGTTSSLNRDLIKEVQQSNRILWRIEDSGPTYA